MTAFGQLRRPTLIRKVFAVFVLAWLHTALLPCAMAVGAAQVLHSQAELPSNAMDAAQMAMADMPDCVYCPTDTQSTDSQVSSMHGCSYPHELRIDSGKAQWHLDQLIAHPVFIPSTAPHLPELESTALPPRYLMTPLARRPLTLTYCVQLK